MKSKYQEQFEIQYPNIEWVTPYTTAKTITTIKYKDCGHISTLVPSNLKSRGNGSVCLVCNKPERALRKTTASFAKEISGLYPNIALVSEYMGAHSKITIKYIDCGHEHSTGTPDSLLNMGANILCKLCYTPQSSLLKTTEEIKSELQNDVYTIVSEYERAFTDITIKYNECGHTSNVRPNNLLSRRDGYKTCRICSPLGVSTAELDLLEYITSIYSGTIIASDRSTIVNPATGKFLELDIYLPEANLAFEYNGIYWHSDSRKGTTYHADKTKLATEAGVTLIHVFEDEWLNTQDIVKSRIKSLLKGSTKIYARKCADVVEIDWSTLAKFCNENHLRGAGSSSSVNLGLYHLGVLVAVMSFSAPKVHTKREDLLSYKADYELVRYCGLLGTNIVGGASKLLKYFTSNFTYLKILSYSDRRWSTGNLYKAIGFEHSHVTKPGYMYFKGTTGFSRQQFQKHKLKDKFPEIFSEAKTEHIIMQEAGYTKVSDCGNDVWVFQ